MSFDEVVAHWQKEAHSALKIAKLVFEADEYQSVLFHCHLAIEKGLKCLYMKKSKALAPKIHDLELLSQELDIALNTEQHDFLSDLNEFAVNARYSDPIWAQEVATASYAKDILSQTEKFLLSLFHE